MNIREIAKKLGVAPSTVSFVLNNRKGVRDELRETIAKELEANGYRIKYDKQYAGMQTIQFFYYHTSNYLRGRRDDTFITILGGAEYMSRHLSYSCVLVNTDEEHLTSDIAHAEQDPAVRGIILMGTEFTGGDPPREILEAMLACKLPIVVLDACWNHLPINTVNINNYQGLYATIGELAKNGHSEIGYVRDRKQYGCLADREECTFTMVKRFGMHIDEANIVNVSQFSERIGEELESYLVQARSLPTAFVADNDFIALNLIEKLHKYGFEVPDDISVVGFDDSPLRRFTKPRLTTAKSDYRGMGEAAVRRMQQLLDDEDEKNIIKLTVESNYVPGDSVGPRRASRKIRSIS